MESNINFVAVDFETATHDQMICQIGLVVVKDGEIVERISRLVQPPGNFYHKGNIYVHHIKPEDTENAPTFDKVWDEIGHYFVGRTLVSHNHSFDESALRKTCDYYGIMLMGVCMPFVCTCALHDGKNLEDVCEGYGMPIDGHHDALFDAECCAKFYLKYLNGEFFDYSLIGTHEKVKYSRKESLHGDVLKKDLSKADPESPFYDRKVVITGDFYIGRIELGDILKREHGADLDTSISKKTHYVLVGEKPGPSKMKKVEKLAYDGFHIKKIYEDDLRKILKKEWEGYHVPKEIIKDLNLTYAHYTNNKISFEGGRNVISGKELYYGKELSGNRDLFAQITGNLGAAGDYEMYPNTQICVLSDSTLDKLRLGEKDETILYIQDYYNNNKSIVFELTFISEGDILAFVKERCEKCKDESTLFYYNRYLGII